ncbi:amino acid/amide ABC transporter ATP-binding protein 2 (HAAT family) [Bradyrhizobium macuxiense]|uniref:Amino acid/amide ABC transporter ATP-binding protein 2 (HAAT family) n=1 Tax=Bradyrhizobium macuxiense TaxID=1755647 RepID=A0A560LCZ4_9BRAD|nr:ABC transporter ATP-binding protein [Bradyrhizobium macuxiense]TWB93187.1 amino acid/amide ABC transporter ATP-binding protein 2 (HAAT family) [Bradyrhizobium macuxiense]
MTTSQFLDVDNIEVLYGQAILALRGVSLRVEQGSIVALLGANGAGKTTTLKAISNLLGSERGHLSRGAITWRGEVTRRLDPADLVARGVVQVLEGRHVFPQLTVEENLFSGGFVRRPSRRALADDLERVYTWFPRLKQRRSARCGLTSGGEQQMVAIGRALMTHPTLVLLDEPSMGLAPIIVEEIFHIIRDLNRNEGVSFLLAEQNAHLVLQFADHGYILENGRVAASGTAAELAERDDVAEFYLGAAPAGSAVSLQTPIV